VKDDSSTLSGILGDCLAAAQLIQATEPAAAIRLEQIGGNQPPRQRAHVGKPEGDMVNSEIRNYTAPIILVLLIVLLGVGATWGYRQLTKPPVEIQPEPCVTQEASVLETSQVIVQVLNGGTAAGRAGQVTDQLTNQGFQTRSPGNTNDAVPATTVIGLKEDDPAVNLVAGFFPDAIKRGDGRTDGVITVVVGDNFSGFNPEAPKQIEVPGGVVCLPSGK